MAMNRDKLEKIIAKFQACAHGYLTRREVRRAREDFEEIVMEIDGGLSHLKWTETVISIPHFTDTDSSCLCPVRTPSEPGLDVSSPLRSALLSEEAADHCELLSRSEPERDDSPTLLPRIPIREDEEEQKIITDGGKDGGVMESTGRSSTIWSTVELDVNSSSHIGPRFYHLAQDVPRTPDALRLHRNTLTMELVWLQQAIDSRKKYLSLKSRLSAS